MSFGDFDAEVKGLNDFPKENRPPVAIPHYAFQLMVGLGTLMLFSGIFYFISLKKTKWQENKKYWLFFACLAPTGFLALEAGWIVTEVGRQPWIIHNVMRTKDAVTPMPGMIYSFYMYVLLYTVLAVAVTWLMSRQIKVLNNSKI